MDIFSFLTRIMLATQPAPAQPAQPVQHVVATQVVFAPVIKATASASDVVNRVQDFYKNVKHVTAQFRQTVTNTSFGTSTSSDGKVWIMKPGKMRWDYYQKKRGATKATREKSFISNGKTLYVVEYNNLQIIEQDLQKDLMPVAVSFLYGTGNLNADFNSEIDKSGTYGGKGEIVLKLTPKQPSAQYQNLFLVVNPSNYRVTQSIIIDSSGNKNHIRFYAPDIKTSVAATWFEFDPRSPEVKNYRIVKANQQQGTGSAAGSAAAPKAPAMPIAPTPAAKTPTK